MSLRSEGDAGRRSHHVDFNLRMADETEDKSNLTPRFSRQEWRQPSAIHTKAVYFLAEHEQNIVGRRASRRSGATGGTAGCVVSECLRAGGVAPTGGVQSSLRARLSSRPCRFRVFGLRLYVEKKIIAAQQTTCASAWGPGRPNLVLEKFPLI